jgi:hypothetical protein
VIVTNKKTTAKKVLMYHNGHATQESIFGELKSQSQLDYIAVRRLYGNQMYMMAAIMAHNLNRELRKSVLLYGSSRSWLPSDSGLSRGLAD